MNDVDFPQGFFRLRHFEKLEKDSDRTMHSHHDRRLIGERTCQPIVMHSGEVATLNIQVLSRQNASWQGKATLFCNKKPLTLYFRSTIELTLAMRMVLMDLKHAKVPTDYDEADDCCATAQSV